MKSLGGDGIQHNEKPPSMTVYVTPCGTGWQRSSPWKTPGNKPVTNEGKQGMVG